MFFTREDILKIQNALLKLSVKDSELPNAEPVTYDDTLSIVQDGKNKQIKIKDFFNQISLWKREDFINITDKYDEHYISLIEAIKLVPILQRKDGLVITFQDIEGNWEIYQFRGNITEFFEENKWFNLYDYRNNIVQSIVPDEEDLTISIPDENKNSLVSLKDRVYDPTSFSGKGYKILRKNIQSVNIASTKITITEVPSSDGTLSFTINGKETQIAVSAITDNTTVLVAQKVASALQDSMTEYDVSIDTSLITLTRKSSGSVTPSVFSASTTGVVCTITDSTKIEFKNILTQDMVNQANTIYVIRYDFTLGEDITIPENCVLKFNGGSVHGEHTITGVNTGIKASLIKIFNTDVTLVGTWNVAEAYPEWFGASENNIDNKIELQKCIDSPFNRILLNGLYDISGTLYINKDVYLRGSGIVCVYANNNAKHIGIHVTNRVNCFEFNKKVNLSLENILIRGFVNDYVEGTIPDYNYSGIYSYYKGTIKDIKGCTIQGFTYGVYSEGAYIGFVLNSFFSACRFGFYTRYTSDYYVIGCGFNTCALNADQSVNTDIGTIHTVGAGVVIHASGMVKFIGNRFEWNYINFVIRETSNQLTVSDNIFDAATVSHIHIFHRIENIEVNDSPYTINNVIFDSNVISKGAGSNTKRGLGIITLYHYTNKKIRVQISNNNVVDAVGDIVGTDRKFENNIIYMFNQCIQNTDPIFELSNNHFNTEATNIFGVKYGSSGNVLIIDNNSDFGNSDTDIWHNVITFRKIEYKGGDTIRIWNTLSDGSSSSKAYDKTISLQANGNNRPTLNKVSKGFVFFDTSLSPARPIWWNGSAWVDATGSTV